MAAGGRGRSGRVSDGEWCGSESAAAEALRSDAESRLDWPKARLSTDVDDGPPADRNSLRPAEMAPPVAKMKKKRNKKLLTVPPVVHYRRR